MIVLTDGFVQDMAAISAAASTIGQTGVTTLVVGTYGPYYNYNALESMFVFFDNLIIIDNVKRLVHKALMIISS